MTDCLEADVKAEPESNDSELPLREAEREAVDEV